MVLAFYYSWYWTKDYSGFWSMWDYGGKHNPDIFISNDRRDVSCPHYPEGGLYDSNDPDVIKRHLKLAIESGIDAFIVSWWGNGNILNKPFDYMLEYARQGNIKLSIYYETVPSIPFKYKNTALDLIEFIKKYGKHESFLRVDNKPVLFFYRRVIKQHSVKQWAEIIKAVKKECNALLVADTLDEEIIDIFDGAHTYSSYEAYLWRVNIKKYMQKLINKCRNRNKYVGISVMPGFDDSLANNEMTLKRRIWQMVVHGKKNVLVERKEGKTYSEHWRLAIDSNPDWILICSFNEWIEGTEIEPSLEFGREYLDITNKYAKEFKSK